VSTENEIPDPYATVPTLWQRHPDLGWGLAVFALTLVLTVVAFPGVNAGEAAYVLVGPAALWAYRKPRLKHYALALLGSQVVAWTILLGWLHNVTWGGLFLLGPFVGLIVGSWFLAAWWAIPRLNGHSALIRILVLLGLAALWVILEWIRSLLFGGFPWLPLAASQWQRPLVLQSASLAGAWSVSFLLVFFGLGTAAYARRIFSEGATGLRKRSPEFGIALLLLIGFSFPFVADMTSAQRLPLARVALVQPYIPQTEKWDAKFASSVLKTLEQVTTLANDRGAPDLIVWPEAVTPWPLQREPNVQAWLEHISKKTGKPLLLGSIWAGPGADGKEIWRNGAFVVDPVAGLSKENYYKRKLVPFGEYIPLRPVLGWLEKVAPIGGDFAAGDSAAPLVVPVGRNRVRFGVLICYEDIFPALARQEAQAGAEVLAVLTNNAWFGEGAAAYQHAAHSVLRAVETRRPVVRCGNGGWSGWIDEFGLIRATLTNDQGTVYFRGAQNVTILRDMNWYQRQTFYTQHGDWFVVTCACLVLLGYYIVQTLRPPKPRPDGKPVF
jgi:apolipoprotein N-acyltransferase